MARKNKIDTKLEIIEAATRLFLEHGYTNVMIADIAKDIGISKGNLAFHFRTKEHLLAELIKMLLRYQWQMMEREIVTGHSALVAYLFEIISAVCVCQEDAVAQNLYVSAYISPLSLQLIRENDTQKAKNIFTEYCPGWKDADFVLSETIASGIEFSMFTANADIPLERLLADSLNAILMLYQIPAELREESIRQVLAMDYHKMGQRMLREFAEYTAEVNRIALEEAVARKAQQHLLKKLKTEKARKKGNIKKEEKTQKAEA